MTVSVASAFIVAATGTEILNQVPSRSKAPAIPDAVRVTVKRMGCGPGAPVRARKGITCAILGVEAPARQGARSAHTGRMQATSNAARPGVPNAAAALGWRQDASAATMSTLFFRWP